MSENIKRYFLFWLLFTSLNFAQNAGSVKLNLTNRFLPFNITEKIPQEFTDFSLVLSGGGARGIAELGVIKALLEEKIPFTRIYGTSIGAVIGGMISSGYSIKEIEKIFLETDWYAFYSLEEKNRNQLFLEQKRILDNAFLTLRIDGFQPVIPKSINSGLLIGNFFTKLKLEAPLNDIYDFDKLRYKFRAVATNLYTGKPVLIKKGDLAQAYRASSSVTFLMPPVKIDSTTLVDGGIVANIPVKVAKKDNDGFVIAIDITSPLRKESDLRYPWEIADQLVSLPMQEINMQNRNLADFVFRPKISKKSDDFTGLDSLIKIGYAEKEKLPELKKRIEKYLVSKEPEFAKTLKNIRFEINEKDLIENEFASQFAGVRTASLAKIYLELYLLKEKFSLADASLDYSIANGKTLLKLRYKKFPLIRKINIFIDDTLSNNQVVKNFIGKYSSPQNIFNIINGFLERERQNGNLSLKLIDWNFNGKGELNIAFETQLLDKITISNVKHTKEYVIRRELAFKKNKPLTKKQLEVSLNNLRLSDLFNYVRINKKDEGEKKFALVVKVSEKPSKLVRLGMKIDNQYLTRVFIDVRNENVLGTGNQIGFSFFGGLRSQEATLEHVAPRIFSSYFTYKLQLNYKHILIPKFSHEPDNFLQTEEEFQYDQSESSFILGFGRQITRLGNLLALWRYSRAKIWNFPGNSEDYTISAIRLNFSIDSRSDVYFAEKGVALNAYYEYAFNAFGANLNFSKTYFNYLFYLKISNSLTLSPRLTLGFADKKLPLSQQFGMGGQFDFYGMDIFQQRGGQVFKASLGLRYKFPFKLIFPVYLGFRYDLGQTWQTRESIKFEDLTHGAGVSLAFKTPIGPAVFSVGRSFYFKNMIPDQIVIFGDYKFYFTLGYYLSFY